MNSERVLVYTLPANRGLPEALNTGILLAYDMQADLIARMDSDDVSVADRIKTQVNFL